MLGSSIYAPGFKSSRAETLTNIWMGSVLLKWFEWMSTRLGAGVRTFALTMNRMLGPCLISPPRQRFEQGYFGGDPHQTSTPAVPPVLRRSSLPGAAQMERSTPRPLHAHGRCIPLKLGKKDFALLRYDVALYNTVHPHKAAGAAARGASSQNT